LGLPSLVLSSRPEQRRLIPLRSGGIMAKPNCSPSPVIPNGVRAVRNLSHPCLVNRRVPHTPVLHVGLGFAGCPRHGVCAWVLGYLPLRFRVPQVRFFTWVLGLPSLVLSSRPERPDLLFRAELWRVGPRSGGIMATPNDSHTPVIPNGVREARFLRPVRFVGVRNPSSSGLLNSTASRSPLSCN